MSPYCIQPNRQFDVRSICTKTVVCVAKIQAVGTLRSPDRIVQIHDRYVHAVVRRSTPLAESSETYSESLIPRVRAGDQAAAEKVFDRYAQQLARLAEQHLSRRIAQRVEGEDVVQSVFRTFFQRAERGEFQIRSSDQLWKLLVTITVRKARMQARRHSAEKRNVELESDDPAALIAAIDREPGPDEAKILDDEIDRVLSGMPSSQQELYRRVLELKLAGHSNREIAAQLELVSRNVDRMLNRLESRFDDRT